MYTLAYCHLPRESFVGTGAISGPEIDGQGRKGEQISNEIMKEIMEEWQARKHKRDKGKGSAGLIICMFFFLQITCLSLNNQIAYKY